MQRIQQFNHLGARRRLQEVNTGAFRPLNIAREVIKLDREDQELYKSATHRQHLTQITFEQTAHVLYHIHQDDLTAMIDGDYKALRRSVHLPAQLTETLHDNTTHPEAKDPPLKRRPIIYQHYHVDPKGDAPTGIEYLAIANRVEAYVRVCEAMNSNRQPHPADLAVSKAIDDTVLAPSKKKAPRVKYSSTEDPVYPRYGKSKNQISGLRQWISSIRKLVLSLPAEQRSQRLRSAISETGWTITENKRRFAHHEHGDQGNKVMNLVDAVTRYLYPRRHYRMKWIVVMEVSSPVLVNPAERTISRVSSSYTTSTGTNQELGGLSTASGDQRLNNQSYRLVCNRLAQPMLLKMQQDDRGLDSWLQRYRDAKQVQTDYRRAKVLEKSSKDAEQQISTREQEQAQAEGEAKQSLLTWSDDIARIRAAIQAGDQMAQLVEGFREVPQDSDDDDEDE